MKALEPFQVSVGRFRGGLVFKVLRLLYHSTLGLRVINKRRGAVFVICATREELLRHLLLSSKVNIMSNVNRMLTCH